MDYSVQPFSRVCTTDMSLTVLDLCHSPGRQKQKRNAIINGIAAFYHNWATSFIQFMTTTTRTTTTTTLMPTPTTSSVKVYNDNGDFIRNFWDVPVGKAFFRNHTQNKPHRMCVKTNSTRQGAITVDQKRFYALFIGSVRCGETLSLAWLHEIVGCPMTDHQLERVRRVIP